jgi:hypothetical protein
MTPALAFAFVIASGFVLGWVARSRRVRSLRRRNDDRRRDDAVRLVARVLELERDRDELLAVVGVVDADFALWSRELGQQDAA